VVEVASRFEDVFAAAGAAERGDEGGQSGDESATRVPVLGRVADGRARVEHAQRCDRSVQRVHRVPVGRQTADEVFEAEVDGPALAEVVVEVGELFLRRQVAFNQ